MLIFTAIANVHAQDNLWTVDTVIVTGYTVKSYKKGKRTYSGSTAFIPDTMFEKSHDIFIKGGIYDISYHYGYVDLVHNDSGVPLVNKYVFNTKDHIPRDHRKAYALPYISTYPRYDHKDAYDSYSIVKETYKVLSITTKFPEKFPALLGFYNFSTGEVGIKSITILVGLEKLEVDFWSFDYKKYSYQLLER